MAKILSYNSPHHIQKEAEKENPLKKVWNWFSKQDRFVKGVIVVGFLLIIVTPAIVTQYFDIRQRAAGETASLYFTLHGTTSPLTTLSVKPGDDVLLDLYLSAPQTNINGLDITTVIPNNNTLVLSSPQTEGPDANKFNSLLFNSWQNNTWRFSKVTTDVNAVNTGNLYIATVPLKAMSLGGGTISFTNAMLTSPTTNTSIPVSKQTLTYNVANPTPTPQPTSTPVPTTPPTSTPVVPTATDIPIQPTNTPIPTDIPVSPTSTSGPTTPPQEKIFYVSRNGNNTDGKTWQTAWNELSNIDWAIIQPGDTIYIDGGTTSMVYNSTLTIGKSGISGSPITIKLSSENGRNGQAIIDGGLTSWIECMPNAIGNPQSSPGGQGVRTVGISLNTQSYVVIDGIKWNGIVVRNHDNIGITVSGNNNTLKYIESHANDDPANGTQDGWGVKGSGSNLTLSHMNIHHNGQDSIQFNGTVTGFNLEYSYLHDHYCRHPDGVQVWGGTRSTGWEIHHNVITAGYLQGIFLGENATADYNAYVDGLDLHDNLIYGVEYGIKSKHGSTTNWNVHHNTLASMTASAIQWCCAAPGGAMAPMNVHDNIFYNVGGFYMPTVGGNTAFTNNCNYNAGGVTGNVSASGTISSDPQFTNPSAGDYSLRSGSPCAGKGSSITSINQLLGSSVPTTTAIPQTTASPIPTPVPADIDSGGCVGIEDFNLWSRAFQLGETVPGADINKDGAVDILDFNVWYQVMKSGVGVCP